MPATLEDLLSQLKAAGVDIEGETNLRCAVALESAKPDELLDMLKTGRKQGIQFLRGGAIKDDDLIQILRGYFPDGRKAQSFLENIQVRR